MVEANTEDPYQTAPPGAGNGLIWVCSVCTNPVCPKIHDDYGKILGCLVGKQICKNWQFK